MLANITATDISAFAGAAIVVGGACGAIGRHVGILARTRTTRHNAETALLQNLTWAVTGKPADQWGPREPGLIEQMSVLNARFDAHIHEEAAQRLSEAASHAAAQLVIDTAASKAKELIQTAVGRSGP